MNKEIIESYINGNINLTLNHIEQLTSIEAALFILELADALVEDCALGRFDVIELLKRRLKSRT